MEGERRDGARRSALGLSDSARNNSSPQEFSRLVISCFYKGMEMSVVFVFEAQAWHKQSNPAQQNARYSTHLTVDNERLELMHPVVGPRP